MLVVTTAHYSRLAGVVVSSLLWGRVRVPRVRTAGPVSLPARQMAPSALCVSVSNNGLDRTALKLVCVAVVLTLVTNIRYK